MRILYLLRHAKSDWANSSLKDFDRPLNERGRKAAKAVGKELRKRRIKPDLVLASPAVRVKQTLERVEDAYGASFEITEDRRIYMAEPEALITLIRNAPDDAKKLMVVGHNPGLQQLVLGLAKPGELRDEAADKFPTGAFAELHFEAEGWRDLAPGTGALESLLRPRDL
jgi:phosphohistidine phosphatase